MRVAQNRLRRAGEVPHDDAIGQGGIGPQVASLGDWRAPGAGVQAALSLIAREALVVTGFVQSLVQIVAHAIGSVLKCGSAEMSVPFGDLAV